MNGRRRRRSFAEAGAARSSGVRRVRPTRSKARITWPRSAGPGRTLRRERGAVGWRAPDRLARGRL